MSVSRLLALARKPHKAAAAGAGVAAGLCLAAVSERASAESMQGRWAWPSASAAETNRLPPGYASRVGNLKDEGAYKVGRKVGALVAKGADIVKVQIGEPDFLTPTPIVEETKRCLDGEVLQETGTTRTGYSHPSGTHGLKAKLANYMNERGEGVGPEHIVIGPGCKPGIFLSILATLQEGDEVIGPDPGFPAYVNAAEIAGAKMVRVPLTNNGQTMDLDALKQAITPKTRMVIVNSPGNPTGAVFSQEHLQEIADVVMSYPSQHIWVLSDEIYSRLIYTGERFAPSMLSVTNPGFRERLILADGFSKTWCMTGYRLGWVVVPAQLAETLYNLMVHAVGCTASFSQKAAMVALPPLPGASEAEQASYDEVEATVADMVATYKARALAVAKMLSEIEGVNCPQPKGAFYAWADIKGVLARTGLTTQEIADEMLTAAEGVAVLPGGDFGPCGEGYMRLSLASSPEELAEGCRRIKVVIDALPTK